MPAPILWLNKIILAKIETVYGTDAVPTAALNGMLTVEPKILPMEGSDVSRDLDLPYLGAQGTIPNELHKKLSFKVELAPSGVLGAVPAWGPLLRACGVQQVINSGVSVVYTPITDNHESLTFYLLVGSTRYVMRGARGTAKFTVDAQAIPYIEFEFTGLFTQPSEQTRTLPTLTAFKSPQVASSTNTPTFTINAVAMVMRSFELDLGNKVEKRFLIGAEAILITQREDMIKTVVEAQPLTAFNPFTLAAAAQAVPINLVHGVGAGKVSTFTVPAAQMQRPQGLQNAQGIKELPLSAVAIPTAGNDQWSLTLT